MHFLPLFLHLHRHPSYLPPSSLPPFPVFRNYSFLFILSPFLSNFLSHYNSSSFLSCNTSSFLPSKLASFLPFNLPRFFLATLPLTFLASLHLSFSATLPHVFPASLPFSGSSYLQFFSVASPLFCYSLLYFLPKTLFQAFLDNKPWNTRKLMWSQVTSIAPCKSHVTPYSQVTNIAPK